MALALNTAPAYGLNWQYFVQTPGATVSMIVTTNRQEATVGQELMSLAHRLFPICRSLTGEGVRNTFAILQEIAPLIVHEIPSGTQVFDWVVPDEWNIRDAYVLDSFGKRVIDFQASNLHVVGYSVPVDLEVTREELEPHLHSLPGRPDAIPYVTSYYARTWGFCLPHRQRLALPKGRYRVKIDATLKPGSMTFADLLIPGESLEEILLSTYICHPSLANNELSGPLVAAFLAKELMAQPRRRYSYRFVFVPETIGSIAYLSQHLDHLKQRVVAGYVLTCLGDSGKFSYLETRLGDGLVDRITSHVLKHLAPGYRDYSWLERGSDERQYGWPGIDLPIGSLMRTKYGSYPEYHTSDDNLRLLSPEALEGSLTMALRCLNAIEANRRYQCQTLCEPQLGKRGLYPTLSTRGSGLEARTLVDLLAYSDGTQDLLAIAERLGKPIWMLQPLVETLVQQGLLCPL